MTDEPTQEQGEKEAAAPPAPPAPPTEEPAPEQKAGGTPKAMPPQESTQDLEEAPEEEDAAANVKEETEGEEEELAEAEDVKEIKKKIRKKDEKKEREEEKGAPRTGRRPAPRREEREAPIWKPRTTIGMRVRTGEVTDIHDVINLPQPIREVEVIDTLLPELDEEILAVDNVQRATDSGRRARFRVVVAVGNKNGYVGVGEDKGKEIGPTIRKAIVRAKLNLREIRRACSSWECGCGRPHTVPFKVHAKRGSVVVTIKPAPRGTGLVSGEVSKKILSLAGIEDARVHTEGHSRTSINFAHAIFDALDATNKVKVSQAQAKKLNIVAGAVASPAPPEPPLTE